MQKHLDLTGFERAEIENTAEIEGFLLKSPASGPAVRDISNEVS